MPNHPAYAEDHLHLGQHTVLVFSAKKIASGKPLWIGRLSGPITSLDVADANADGKSDIVLTTASQAKVALDFNGHPPTCNRKLATHSLK